MVSKDVISSSCIEDFVWEFMHLLRTMVLIGKRIDGLECDNLVLKFEMIGMVGICLGLVVGSGD